MVSSKGGRAVEGQGRVEAFCCFFPPTPSPPSAPSQALIQPRINRARTPCRFRASAGSNRGTERSNKGCGREGGGASREREEIFHSPLTSLAPFSTSMLSSSRPLPNTLPLHRRLSHHHQSIKPVVKSALGQSWKQIGASNFRVSKSTSRRAGESQGRGLRPRASCGKQVSSGAKTAKRLHFPRWHASMIAS